MVQNPKSIQISLTNRAFARVFQNLDSDSSKAAEKLGQILVTFYERMAADIFLEHFFYGKDLKHIARMQKEFLMKAMGASASYTGKPPADAHKDIPNILEGHFDRRLQILEQTLQDYGVPSDDIKVWISFENAFRAGIVVEEGSVRP